jgi:hypothetical protein
MQDRRHFALERSVDVEVDIAMRPGLLTHDGIEPPTLLRARSGRPQPAPQPARRAAVRRSNRPHASQEDLAEIALRVHWRRGPWRRFDTGRCRGGSTWEFSGPTMSGRKGWEIGLAGVSYPGQCVRGGDEGSRPGCP